MADDSARWVIASENLGKQREIRQILSGSNVELQGLSGFGRVSFPEEGLDYRENAIQKARAVANQIDEIAVADDSGIEVDALEGGPGPLSAGFGGEGLSDRDRLEKLLAVMVGVREAERTARFVCYAALATPDGDTVVAYGECKGVILSAPEGEGGFGYDPIFRPDGFSHSLGRIEPAVKNRMSHRALAFLDLYARWVGLPHPNASY